MWNRDRRGLPGLVFTVGWRRSEMSDEYPRNCCRPEWKVAGLAGGWSYAVSMKEDWIQRRDFVEQTEMQVNVGESTTISIAQMIYQHN